MDVNLADRALVALRDALGVVPGDTLLLISDSWMSDAIRDSFATAGWALGATVLEMSYTALQPVAVQEFGKFAAASLRPQPHLPAPVVSALATADAAVILNGDMTIMFDDALRALIGRRQTKLAWAPYLTTEALLRLLPRSTAECHELLYLTTKVAERLRGAHDARVTSPAGTALDLRIGSFGINVGTGVATSGAGYGGLEIWPGGQVSTVPDPATAHGRLVIDRSINAPRFMQLSAPIEFRVEEGRVVDISGCEEARELRDWLTSLADTDAYNLTELGIGTNTRCSLAGVAAPCEDTHTLGCVSFALGADVHLGGTVSAPCHVDMTMRSATLELDGRPIVDAGTVNP